MQAVSANFLAALRHPHSRYIEVLAYRNGVRVGGELRIEGGQIEQSAGLIASPRRNLSLELAPAKGLWDALAPVGTTLYPRCGIRYVDGSTEWVPMGVFDVDEQSMTYGPSGTLSITAPDAWVRVQRARYELAATTTGSVLQSAVFEADAAVRLGIGSLSGNFTITAREQLWERDRDDAIAQLARAAGAWIYLDPLGRVTTRPIPALNSAAVWTVDASESGVLLDASRVRSRQRTYNVVIVSGADVSGITPFNPVKVEDSDPTSPTFTGGPFGRVPFFYSSALLTTASQAQSVGKSLLRRVSGLAASLELTSIVNPALEVGDVIQALLPNRVGDGYRVENHLVDSVSTPFDPGGTQAISTRSTRPEGDVPDEGS